MAEGTAACQDERRRADFLQTVGMSLSGAGGQYAGTSQMGAYGMDRPVAGDPERQPGSRGCRGATYHWSGLQARQRAAPTRRRRGRPIRWRRRRRPLARPGAASDSDIGTFPLGSECGTPDGGCRRLRCLYVLSICRGMDGSGRWAVGGRGRVWVVAFCVAVPERG
jgi:hypothetical protein